MSVEGGAHLFHIVIIVAADDQATAGAKTSAGMVLV